MNNVMRVVLMSIVLLSVSIAAPDQIASQGTQENQIILPAGTVQALAQLSEIIKSDPTRTMPRSLELLNQSAVLQDAATLNSCLQEVRVSIDDMLDNQHYDAALKITLIRIKNIIIAHELALNIQEIDETDLDEESTRVRPYGTPALFYGPVVIDDPTGNPALLVDGPTSLSELAAGVITAQTINVDIASFTDLTVDNLTVVDSLTLEYTTPGDFLYVSPNGQIVSRNVIPGSGIQSVNSGVNIFVNNTSPTAPIVNVAGTTPLAVQIGNATNGGLQSLSFGTSGQVLTSNGAGSSPSWQAAPASSITITGDTGGALTGDSFTFTGGTTGLKFNGGGTTETLGGTLAVANGGTGATSFGTIDGTVYYNGTNLTTTATGATGQVLTSNGTGAAPTYQSISAIGAVTSVNAGTGIDITGTATAPIVNLITPVSIANGGTGATSLAANGIIISNAGGTALTSQQLTNGQLLIGNSGNAPSAAQLTAGTGIVISNGAGSISISANGGGTVPNTFVTPNGTATPAGGVININGSPSQGITTSGAGNTVTINATNASATAKGVASFSATNFTVTGGNVASNNFSINPGTGLTGGGSLTLGGSTTISLSTPVSVTNGGTGLSTLTAHNVLLGEGTANVGFATPTTTTGIPLVSTGPTSDPAFGTASVQGGGTGSTSFTANAPVIAGATATSALTTATTGIANSGYVFTSTGSSSAPTWQPISAAGAVTSVKAGNNISVTAGTSPIVSVAGTTTNAVQIGNATGSLTSLAVGTNGQVLLGASGAAPAFANLTSTSGTLAFTTGANSLSIDVNAPLPIAYGGTNATSMTNTDGVVYFDGTLLNTTTVGTSGQVLTSQGAGMPPTFQSMPASSSADVPNTLVLRDGSGDFATNMITIDGTPSASTDVATVAYVLAHESTGLVVHSPAVLVGTVDEPIAGPATIDGSPVVSGERILLVDQTTSTQNGLWLAAVGAGSPWSRPDDFSNGTEAGTAYVLITNGQTYAGSSWVCSTPTAIIGSSPIFFNEFSLPSQINGANVGSGPGQVFQGKSGLTLNFRTLIGDPYIAVATSGNEVTITSDATSTNTPSTIVARDASGNFSAGTISATNLVDTGVNQYAVVVGGGTNPLTGVASSTAGSVLVSGGSAANPAFVVPSVNGNGLNVTHTASTLAYGLVTPVIVANGGTGSELFNTNGIVLSGASSTTPLVAQQLTAGELLIGTAAGTAPSAAQLTAGTGIAITNGAGSISISASGALPGTFVTPNGNATPAGGIININGSPSQGITTSGAGNTITINANNASTTAKGVASFNATNFSTAAGVVSSNPIAINTGAGLSVSSGSVNLGGTTTISLTTVPVANGGTGLSTLTAHNVLLGEGTANVGFAAPGTAGQILVSNGAAADPSFKSLSTAGAVTQINGDTGSAMPASGIITFNANSNAGSTVEFSASGSTVDLLVTNPTTQNTFIGLIAGNTSSPSATGNTGIGYAALPELVCAFGQVKLACAQANRRLGSWRDDPEKADAIERACREMGEGPAYRTCPGRPASGGRRDERQHECQRGARQPRPGSFG